MLSSIRLAQLVVASLFAVASLSGKCQEVLVVADISELIEQLQAEDWWGEEDRADQLRVPRITLTGINPQWRVRAQELTVAEKKEVFYRLILPLVAHANEMVVDRRSRFLAVRETIAGGGQLSTTEMEALRDVAVLLRVANSDDASALPTGGEALLSVVDEILYRLDVIPAGLALGQAAYESGYGTSTFAIEGNALFGQWTYGGEGLIPAQQRADLGDHRIAAFDWPFDSVRGYFLNLMSHPAYEEFRQLRAELREQGMPLDSITLADGLINYSERRQEYVDTLKSIIRVNNLDIADNAVLRDESIRFVIGAADEADAQSIRTAVESARASGELADIVARMRLE